MELSPRVVELVAAGKWCRAIRKWIEEEEIITNADVTHFADKLVPWVVKKRRATAPDAIVRMYIYDLATRGVVGISIRGNFVALLQQRATSKNIYFEDVCRVISEHGYVDSTLLSQHYGVSRRNATWYLVSLFGEKKLTRKSRGKYVGNSNEHIAK